MKFKLKQIGLLFLGLGIIQPIYSGEFETSSTRGFTSWLPASEANQALLIGNGTMGALVFGHPHDETIIMSHSSLYLPTGNPKKPIDQARRLEEIRKLIAEGNGAEAAKIPVEQSLIEGYEHQIWSDPYIPAFDILIKTDPANSEKYQRSVNFETGEAIVAWTQNGRKFERRQFISRADNAMVVKLNADTLFNVELIFRQRPVKWNEWDYIHSNIKSTKSFAKGSNLYYQSEFVNQWDENIAGYEGVGKVISANGIITSTESSVKVSYTNEVILLVKIAPHQTGASFKTEFLQQQLNGIDLSYEELLTAHQKIHSTIYNRLMLDLNADEADKKLNSEVTMQIAKNSFRPAFVEKQFNAARYNILCATGSNPPNLQGIWGISWQPPWSSDYTNDGNLPVAISSFMCSSMPELMSSFFDYHDARLQYYRDNAMALYGCRGIQVPSHSSSHGWNVHFDPVWCLTFWNGGAAWTANFYFDYWLYTNDMDFLLERAYPFMKEAALFYEDFVILGDDGKYVFNPSYSPENNPSNNPSQATINATMDVMLANQLFRNLIKAGKVVKEKKKQIREWEDFLAKLPDYEVDSSGTLREWLWNDYMENHKHRHVSHLYGMYDIIDPEIAESPELWEGVKKAVDQRMAVRRQENGGIMVFGLVQMAWVASNLGDAELVEEIIRLLSSQYWSNSFASYHDPDGLFNLDLSGGFQTVVIRALVYSEPGYISLLPAKPPSWDKGSIKGVSARNQVNIEELSWSDDEVHLVVNSPLKQKVTIKLPKSFNRISLDSSSGKLMDKISDEQTVVLYIPENESVQLTLKH